MKLSIIIPTLNEATYLPVTIEKIKQNAGLEEPYEIIVVDSGSTDETCDIALKLGVKLVKSKGTFAGRAYVLNQAVEFASGDVLLFLDADTLVPQGYDESIENALSNPNVVGGAFEFSLEGPQFGLRVVELINRIRYRIRQRYYGDQGIFVRSHVFRIVGGYPEIGILEAAHFCKKLRKEGELKLIKKRIYTSPRRFLDGGVYKVLGRDIKIWFLDLIGISVDKYADAYWKENKLRAKNQ
ncbi:MAG: TIGR04283 family arsenosugar biosynthesis glycosyltransferase [Candidatus Dadabacteria bacterium]|jgi:rSAM/selenodomain-associated transferase 2|nr:TIGR04283 family arsenosugar biosynthesis glycosyltransferase [Candidatus Dadabacteria bacterium]MCZ6554708.1 TIGR04283 family arsenosugar biosynthesis glycosyltransferase [Candidatus Dadabacteria bacterium]MCZ6638663.1 TIGR04283 family arsenosugar biosynthesis glycosyltransferase [Candidatus Dadabacteria bacterium]MCZ6685273.1 TIGR04283 family arsenosugar biosynthesis glycosyltransferase [Candidatus Dadabacteria bacterium]MCZ6791011.1 TIGR04283 family arsenosugar biosynthesis glycosyltransf